MVLSGSDEAMRLVEPKMGFASGSTPSYISPRLRGLPAGNTSDTIAAFCGTYRPWPANNPVHFHAKIMGDQKIWEGIIKDD